MHGGWDHVLAPAFLVSGPNVPWDIAIVLGTDSYVQMLAEAVGSGPAFGGGGQEVQSHLAQR